MTSVIKKLSAIALLVGFVVSGTISASAAEAPDVTATGATSVSQSSAALNASIILGGSSAEYWMEYGTDYNFNVTTNHYSLSGTTGTRSVSQTVTNLTPETVYYYRIKAQSSDGLGISNIKSFTTQGYSTSVSDTDMPDAIATGTSSVSSGSATLNGTVDANNLSTTYKFEYGIDDFSKSKSGSSSITGDHAKSVSVSVSSLSAGTTYQYRIVAKNSEGTSYSNIKTFTTSGGSTPSYRSAPTVTISSAHSITRDSAALSGSIDPNNSRTEYWFEYGTYSNNLNYSTSKWSINSFSGNTPVSSPIYNLQNGTTYYYRLVADNSYGTEYSPVWSFVTQASRGGNYHNNPYITTREATEKYSSSAVLNADVSPNGYQTDMWFEYGYSGQSLNLVSGNRSVPANNGSQRVSVQVNNLSPNTYYDFRAVARTSYGTFYGDIISFRTSIQNNEYYYGEPQVVTVGSSNVLQNVAVLQGSVNPSGSAGSVWFEYGTSAYNLNGKTTSISVPSHIALKNYYIAVTGLSSSTTYYYRVVCSNAYGISKGEIKSFKTSGYWRKPYYDDDLGEKKVIIKEQISTDEDSGVILDPSVSSLEPKVGDTIDYVLTYRNASKETITGVSLKVTLPFETEYIDSNVKPTSQTGNNLVFYIGDVEKGGQGAITIKVKISEDTAEGSSIMFNSFLEYTDGKDDFQTVNSYIAVLVKESANAGFLGSLSSFTKSFSESWLMLILLLLMFIIIIYLFVTRNKRVAVEEAS